MYLKLSRSTSESESDPVLSVNRIFKIFVMVNVSVKYRDVWKSSAQQFFQLWGKRAKIVVLCVLKRVIISQLSHNELGTYVVVYLHVIFYQYEVKPNWNK